jgi:ribosomal-protein-alanine N-acetyltransferase
MSNITLFALDHAAAERLASDAPRFAQAHALVLAPHEVTVVAIADGTARLLSAGGAVMPWVGYLALDGPMRRVVGTCGFKGAPDADRAVEIAYFTFSGEEGRGVATAMAEALVRVARASAQVSVVRAHTLPEHNASCRVLVKVGFEHAGSIMDPEDGPVWRWEQPVPHTTPIEAPRSNER